MFIPPNKLKDNFQVIKTQTRGDLFPTTVDFIAQAIEQKKVKPNEIAIIAAGLDEIARYSLQSSFNQHHIESRFLQEQRPLITSAIVRGILTLICFIYEDLGKLLTKDMVTEMLVVLSHRSIDLVRSGLLVDYCYVADLKQPHLLNLDQFPYWQRLNVETVEAYQPIVEWINEQAEQVKTNQLDFFCLVDNIIDRFFPSQSLNYTQLSNLRAFTETIEHLWQVQKKLANDNQQNIITQLIMLLRRGTITANPLPIGDETPSAFTGEPSAITIANIYQYRTSHQRHKWHFWLDVCSNSWSQNSSLFASEVFLRQWQPHLSYSQIKQETEADLLSRVINDLLARVNDRVFLCHSILTTNGSEQNGQLFSLVEFLTSVSV